MAAASGVMICSRFLMRNSAARPPPNAAEPGQAGEQLDQAFDLGAAR